MAVPVEVPVPVPVSVGVEVATEVAVPVVVSVGVVVAASMVVGDRLGVDPELPQDATDNAMEDAIHPDFMCIRMSCLLAVSV